MLIMMLFTTTVLADSMSATENESQNMRRISARVSVAKPKFPKVRRTSGTSLQLKWKRVSGVKGYVIYRYNKSKKKYARVKTINNRTSTKWTDRKLEKDKTYKYRLRSYKRVSGKKVYSGYTYSISAKTYSKSAKKVNAGSITVKSSITIGLAGKSAVKVKIKPSKFGNAKKKSIISKRIRFVSANSKVVIDGKKGKLNARKPGTTNVYAVAHNGNLKKIKVKVVDYAKPVSWRNLDEADERMRMLLDEHSSEIQSIASYFSTHPGSQNSEFQIDDNGELVNINNLPVVGIESTLMNFLRNSPYAIHIITSDEVIVFELVLGGIDYPHYEYLQFNYYDDVSENKANQLGMVKLAKQWFHYDFTPV
jgi:hypothetical protein